MALAYYESALLIFRERQVTAYTAITLAEIGKASSKLDRLEDAHEALTEASSLCEDTQDLTAKGICYCGWAYYFYASDDLPKARESHARARSISKEIKAGEKSQLSKDIKMLTKLIDGATSNK